MGRTIGQAIGETAQEYIELYERLKQDESLEDPAGLAVLDLWRRAYIAKKAQVIVEAYIAKQGGQ